MAIPYLPFKGLPRRTANAQASVPIFHKITPQVDAGESWGRLQGRRRPFHRITACQR